MSCNKDCINCGKEYCTNVYSEKSLYKNRSEEQKQYQRDYHKRKREEAKTKGYCCVCCKRKATHGSKCYECYIRQKRYDRAKYDHRRELWKEKGLCYMCGAAPLPGKKTCKKHYGILISNLETLLNVKKTKMAQRKFVEESQRMVWK